MSVPEEIRRNLEEKYGLTETNPPVLAQEVYVDSGTARKPALQAVTIVPHEGIGPLKLGMEPAQILLAIQALHRELGLPASKISISEDLPIGKRCCRRYQDGGWAFFLVTYEQEQAVEIAVDCSLREVCPVLLGGLDCFKMKAETLVQTLQRSSPCIWDDKEEQFATNYEFPALGIRLWRENAFDPRCLTDPVYRAEKGEDWEERQYLYFQVVAVQRR